MKKVIEFNPRFNVGDMVYVLYYNRMIKGKVRKILGDIEDDIIGGVSVTNIRYSIIDTETKDDIVIFDSYKAIFKLKEDAIDYLKTQIDKITTDDYNQTFTANN